MKVSNLTVAGALSAGDLFYLVQGTNSRKLALSSLSSYILTGGFTATLDATTVTSLTSSGAIAANGGSITTTVTTFALIDTVATTVNFARAATAITMGATTGTTTVRNNLTVSGGTVTATTFTGNASTASTLQTARTITLAGDVTGSVAFDGSANVSITTTIAANSVTLGTDTTGNYVATITGTADRITVTGSGAEDAAVTINADATSANTANKIVARDASGNFSAGTITATLSGNVNGGSVSATTITASGAASLNAGVTVVGRSRLDAADMKVSALGSGSGTRALDQSIANYFSATVAGATTFTFTNPPPAGYAGAFMLELTNGGSATVTWPASVDWPGGTAPTLTAAGVDVLVFISDDQGTIWRGNLVMKDSK